LENKPQRGLFYKHNFLFLKLENKVKRMGSFVFAAIKASKKYGKLSTIH